MFDAVLKVKKCAKQLTFKSEEKNVLNRNVTTKILKISSHKKNKLQPIKKATQ